MINTENQVKDPQASSNAQTKWGYAATLGFAQVPDILFKSQSQLGLDCTELVILLNVLSHWWFKGRNPFPTTYTLAKRANVSPRTAQRAIKALQEKGLVAKARGDHGREFDLEPLVRKLNTLAMWQPKAPNKGGVDVA